VWLQACARAAECTAASDWNRSTGAPRLAPSQAVTGGQRSCIVCPNRYAYHFLVVPDLECNLGLPVALPVPEECLIAGLVHPNHTHCCMRTLGTCRTHIHTARGGGGRGGAAAGHLGRHHPLCLVRSPETVHHWDLAVVWAVPCHCVCDCAALSAAVGAGGCQPTRISAKHACLLLLCWALPPPCPTGNVSEYTLPAIAAAAGALETAPPTCQLRHPVTAPICRSCDGPAAEAALLPVGDDAHLSRPSPSPKKGLADSAIVLCSEDMVVVLLLLLLVACCVLSRRPWCWPEVLAACQNTGRQQANTQAQQQEVVAADASAAQ